MLYFKTNHLIDFQVPRWFLGIVICISRDQAYIVCNARPGWSFELSNDGMFSVM
jgi:hypothetical protein